MTKDELILVNYTEKVATANMLLEVGTLISKEECHLSLWNTYRRINQLQSLFEYEVAKTNSDLVLATKVAHAIKKLLGSYLKIDTIYVTETIIEPKPLGTVVIQLQGGSGNGNNGQDGNGFIVEFKYITPDQNNVIHIDGTIRKATISENTKLDALGTSPGQTGILIVRQDDLGGNVITLAPGNKGAAVVLNTFPRAETRFTWERYDNNVYWKNEILDQGIAPTTIPVFAINDYLNKLDIFHQAGYSEIEISTDGGPWLPYLEVADPVDKVIYFGAVDLPAGYWRARVRANEPTRLVSLIASSNAVHAAQTGFNYTLDLTLT